jgi:hypothetical protein
MGSSRNSNRKERRLKNNINDKEMIVKYILNKDFGETIKFEELQPYTKYNLLDETESYIFKSSIMSKVKNILIEYGYVLKSIRYVGYYLLKPNQIQSYTYRNYIKKPLKAFMKAECILSNTNTKRLETEELIRHQLTTELSRNLIDETNKIINSKEYINLDEFKDSLKK